MTTLLFRNFVHEAIRFAEQFSNERIAKLWDNLTPLGELHKRCICFFRFFHERGSVVSGVLRDVLRDPCEIIPSGIGPFYFSSHLAMRRRASS